MSIQERWDATFQKLDRSCPAQRADEAQVDYLRRLSRIGRKYIPRGEQMASINFAELPDKSVPKFSELMRNAVERNLYRTDNMAPGEMRAVMRTDENTGQKNSRIYRAAEFCAELALRPSRLPAGDADQRPRGVDALAGRVRNPSQRGGRVVSFRPVRLGERRGRPDLLTGRPMRGRVRQASSSIGPSRIRPLFFEGFRVMTPAVNFVFVPYPVPVGNGVGWEKRRNPRPIRLCARRLTPA